MPRRSTCDSASSGCASAEARFGVTPAKLGAWVRKPQLEQQMNAKDLQQQVVAKSAGQASDVVDAVYEDSSAASGGTSPPSNSVLAEPPVPPASLRPALLPGAARG